MNKNKLRSLMFHAGFCNEDGGWDTRPIHEQEYDNFQRFAELIVSECIGQLNKIPVRAEPLGGQTFNYIKLETAIETLEEYFGVTR